MLRLDLHIHTCHSKDSAAPVHSVIQHCQAAGLGPVAITDHNNIRGALEARDAAPFPVIIGEEVKSSAGDIIGLFLSEAVPGGLSPRETARRIKDQGGLVLIPHPFDRVRPSALGLTGVMDILPLVDLMEGYNAHTFLRADNRKGLDFCKEQRLPAVACSDAHSAIELGGSYTEVPEEEYDGTPTGLVRAVRAGNLVGKRPNPLLLLAPGYARLRKVLV